MTLISITVAENMSDKFTDFVCATCSGAMSEMERQTLKFVFGMGAIAVLSFTWFAGGFLGSV